MRKKKDKIRAEEKLYIASQWQLMGRKFLKHRLAIFGGTLLFFFYFIALFCEFFATQDIYEPNAKYIFAPPQRIRFFDEKGFHLRPFVYELTKEVDPVTWENIYTEDKNKKHFIYFFVHGDKYKLWNLFPTDIHFFGVKEGTLFLFGTEKLGRDLFSRTLYATRI